MPNPVNIPDRLLLTGPNGGGVALVSRSRFEILFEGAATGLSLSRNQAAWVVQDDDANRVCIVSDGQLTSTRLSDDALDLHDIFLDGKRFWAVATQLNAVLCLDQDKEVRRWVYSSEPDSWHINSLVRHDGTMLASAFGRFSTFRGYKEKTRGSGEVFEVKTGQAVIEGLSQPHSLVSADGMLWLCNSEVGEVHAYEKGQCVRRVKLPGYTRGLAIGPDHLYVGISRTRNEPSGKVERRFESAAVAVVDRSSGEVLGYFPVPWNEIYDIRVLPFASLAEDLLLSALERRAEPSQDSNLVELVSTIHRQHAEVIRVISEDIRHMQATVANSLERAASYEGKAAVAEQLASRIEQIAAVLERLESSQGPAIAELASAVHSQHAEVIRIMSEDIRHMQATVATSLERAASHEAKAAVAEQLAARIDQLGAARADGAVLDGLKAIRDQLEVLQEAGRQALATLQASDARRSESWTGEIGKVAEGQAALSERAGEASRTLQSISERIDDLHATQQASIQKLDGMDGVVEQLSRVAGSVSAAEALTTQTYELLVQEFRRVSGLPGMQERLDEAISSQAKLQEEARALQAGIQSLNAQVADLNSERQQLLGEIESRRRETEVAEARLEEQRLEIATLRHESERIRNIAIQYDQVVRSFSWRSTRPLRVASRLLMGRWTMSDADGMTSAWRKLLMKLPLGPRLRSRLIAQAISTDGATISALPNHHMAAVLGIPPAAEDLPDVFVWSVIDFHFRIQRPQHLARAMAQKGHRVFYVSINFWDVEEPGFHFDALDDCGRLYQIHLHLAGQPSVYSGMPSDEQSAALQDSLAVLLAWTGTRSSISLVQHPYWSELMRSVPNARVVYDCMDHHAGFDNNSADVLEAERRLIDESELTIVTSAWLEAEVSGRARTTAVIRNAGEFDFFSDPPAETFRDTDGRKVIGYYGAIAGWFDVELVRRVAEAHPEALVVLVGHDSVGGGASLAELDNVLLVGEVPYARLPYWLHGFDVCLLPFRVLPLTLATNPVKVYEYLAAGKPVVAVDLPEMAQFEGLVHAAADHDDFVAKVSEVLAVPASAELIAARQAYAAEQTWDHRAAALDAVIQDLDEPRISVVVLTYNNLPFTQACLYSLEVYSDYRNLEIIVVDNASSDGSPEYLEQWSAEPSAAGHTRRLILNRENLGFAAGNNIGLAAATGEVLVLLNNDVFVTPGWVRTLHAHLKRDRGLGLVGPVTNNIGNEARINLSYTDMEQMVENAGRYTRAHPGKHFPINTLAFFCVMLPKAVFEAIGGLDEAFGLGFFEDDDYCRRVQAAGWKVACAEDVFVHHHLSASFDQVGVEKKMALFEKNKAIYEAKWGAWTPHVYRPSEDGKERATG